MQLLPCMRSNRKERMRMTQRLYEQDAYCRSFTATVESCAEKDGAYAVVLDRTAFFPEGGGQAADKGTLNGVPVLDVQLCGEKIVHKTESSFSPGETVTGELDWDLRFSRMQSHAGEHIVSGLIHAMFGYDNVGFHMSETVMTLDVNGPLTREDIEKIELRANRAVYDNVAITASCPDREALAEIPYRSKIEARDGIRLITIEGVDCCACCAPHPSKTGEIGVIKLLDFCPYKKGTRIEMTAGIHALRDYAALHNANKSMMSLLSAKRHEVQAAAERQSALIDTLRAEKDRLSKELALYKLQPVWVGSSVYSISVGLSYEDLRHCVNAMTKDGAAACIFLSETEAGAEEYLYVVSSAAKTAGTMAKALNSTFCGKGGGRPEYAQGKLSASSAEILRETLAAMLQTAE